MCPDLNPDTIEKLILIEERLLSAAKDDRINCAEAQAVARSLGVPMHEVGQVADRLKIKISRCQLGCF